MENGLKLLLLRETTIISLKYINKFYFIVIKLSELECCLLLVL